MTIDPEKYKREFYKKPIGKFFQTISTSKNIIIEITRSEDIQSKIYIENNRPIFVQSNYFPEQSKIGFIFKTLGIITDKELEKVLKIQKETGKKTGEIVMGMKKIDLPTLDRILNYQQELRLIFALSSKIKSMRVIVVEKITGVPRYSINYLRAVFTVAQNNVNSELAKEFTENNKTLYLVWEGNKEKKIISSSKQEQQIVDYIIKNSGTKRVMDLYAITRLTRQKTSVILLTLFILDLIKLSKDPVIPVEDVEKELREELEGLKSKNYFERINAHWSCVPHEIEKWYKETIANYQIKKDDPESVKTVKKQIIEKLDESYQKLMDENFRKNYRNEIVGEYRIKLGAELVYEKAETEIFFRNDGESAYELFSTLVEVGDKRPKVLAGLGCSMFMKFRGKDPLKAKEGENLINKIENQFSNDADVLLCSAFRHILKNNLSTALKLLGKVLQIKPKHSEALRLIKKIQGKE